jgi:hypothetical protein
MDFMDQSKKYFTYLIIADETEEFGNAMRYAARTAQAHGAKIAVLMAIPENDFLHWGTIEDRMKQEQRAAAEQFVLGVAERIRSVSDLFPVFYIEDGDVISAAARVMNENKDICKLILGANTKAGGSNPIVDHFSGKGIGKLPVPMMIVPDHIPLEKIDELT